MTRICNENLTRALELAEQMLRLADQGDAARQDIGCGVLYGIVRDSAYRIGKLAEAEIERHKLMGMWAVGV